jgi:hypothetical protein
MNEHAPPGKETACYDTRRISKLDWAETTATRVPLQACRHSATRAEPLPDGSLHYARLFCAICGCHLCWLPMSSVERRTLRRLSLRQRALVARLYATYLEGKTP